MSVFHKIFNRIKRLFLKEEKTIKEFIPEYLKWYRAIRTTSDS